MGGTDIIYRPILDSLYHCPGITIREKAERKKIIFVRCSIDNKCPTDIPSENIGAGQFKVAVPFTASKIDVIFEDGETKLLR